jgi:AbrB family looped-hinge helix DNA binding protein
MTAICILQRCVQIDRNVQMNAISARMFDNGGMLVPADVRHLLGMKPGDELQLTVVGDELRVMTRKAAIAANIRRAQAILAADKPTDGRSAVDDLIADRRVEAAHDDGFAADAFAATGGMATPQPLAD